MRWKGTDMRGRLPTILATVMLAVALAVAGCGGGSPNKAKASKAEVAAVKAMFECDRMGYARMAEFRAKQRCLAAARRLANRAHIPAGHVEESPQVVEAAKRERESAANVSHEEARVHEARQGLKSSTEAVYRAERKLQKLRENTGTQP
jgi:hypothetical protein